MPTNREHFEQTDATAEEVTALQELAAPIAEGLTVAYESDVKKITKLTIVSGIITELEVEE